MKSLCILFVALFASSCSTAPSFHRLVFAGETCEATYYLIQGKLTEASEDITREFGRLQRIGPATRDSRIGLLAHGAHHFPKEEMSMLYPLLEMGCRDPDAKVRKLAMGLLVDYFGKSAIGDLQRMTENATPEVRVDITGFIEEQTTKNETAPNTPAQGMLRSAPQP